MRGKKTITFKSIFYCLTHSVSKSVKILNYKKASLDFFKISLLFLLKEQFLQHLKRVLNISIRVNCFWFDSSCKKINFRDLHQLNEICKKVMTLKYIFLHLRRIL